MSQAHLGATEFRTRALVSVPWLVPRLGATGAPLRCSPGKATSWPFGHGVPIEEDIFVSKDKGPEASRYFPGLDLGKH